MDGAPERRYHHGMELAVVISDLHCGSSVGLMPPFYDDVDDGPSLRANKVQRWLWKCWLDFTESWLPEVVGDDPWVLVVNGDLIDGVHHHSTQVHPDETVHARIACEVLAPFAELAEKRYVIRGTEVHVKNLETGIAASLQAEPSEQGWCHDHLMLNVGGCRVSFQHHIGASVRPWLGGYQLLASLVEEQFRAASRGHDMPDVIVRSHRHVYGALDTPHGMCVITPPWQALTKYGKKVTRDMIAVVGGVVLDWRQSDDGMPLVHRKLYTAKPTKELEA